MTSEDLLNTLMDLREEEFKDFKWYLQQPVILQSYQTIKVSKLEAAERRETVDLMVNIYKLHGALKVTKKVLEKINRNDLVQILPDTSSGPEGQSHFYLFAFSGKKSGLTFAVKIKHAIKCDENVCSETFITRLFCDCEIRSLFFFGE